LPGKVIELSDDGATLQALGISNCSQLNLEETQLPEEILEESDSEEEKKGSEPAPSQSPQNLYRPSYFYKIGIVRQTEGSVKEEQQVATVID